MAPIRLALLICDHYPSPFKDIHGQYDRIYTRFLTQSLARISADSAFTLDCYDVVSAMAYPPDDAQYDGVLITGSRTSAYGDVAWIHTLVAYIKRILAEKPSLKLFGICFGHQIVARALGSACVPNERGWEVSVTAVRLTPLGKAIFGTDADELDIQQMHKDHVPTLPAGTHLLGRTDPTPNHGMVLFDPASAPSPETLASDAPLVDLTSIRVLTIQGHPEFTEPIMGTLLDSRVAVLGEELVRDGHLRKGGIPGKVYPDGLTCDGVCKFGKTIWGVLGVA